MTTLDIRGDVPAFDAEHAILRQVGWVGHSRGEVYPMHAGPTSEQEPGGFSPLYIQVGRYVFDGNGNKMWRD